MWELTTLLVAEAQDRWLRCDTESFKDVLFNSRDRKFGGVSTDAGEPAAGFLRGKRHRSKDASIKHGRFRIVSPALPRAKCMREPLPVISILA